MKYVRMPIEKESPEQLGYDKIKFNLTESSVRDRPLKDLNADVNDILLCYGDHAGNPGLREIISAENENLNPENVLYTAGASAALFIAATSLLKSGDHLILARPNYATNIETPKAIGCDMSYLDLSFENNFQIDLDELESMIRPKTKFISVTYPHNPYGVMIDEQKLVQLIQLVESKEPCPNDIANVPGQYPNIAIPIPNINPPRINPPTTKGLT